MNVEIVWLAYDPALVERAWRNVTVRQLYMEILQDDFRKRVDPRSMLFHKGQFYLLNDLEVIMKRGGNDITLEEYLAKMFHKGVEEFPTEAGELSFDYRLISYFTSLRMADDYNMVEPFFKNLLVSQGVLDASQPWNLLNIENVDAFFGKLTEANLKQVMQATDAQASIKLLTNYIEFYNYTRNNHLGVFFYNNQIDVRRWGNLTQRKADRDKHVVELTYNKTARQRAKAAVEKPTLHMDDNLISKMRFKRRIENLEAGLQDADALIRQKAAEGLGVAGNYQSVMPLIEALSDEAAEVRQEAVRALGAIRDPRSVDAIIQLILKDESRAVIMSGAQSLVNIGEARGLETLVELLLRGVYEVAVQVASFPGLMKNRTAVNMLVQAMHHPNEVVRRQVAFILGDIPSKPAVDVLIESLGDADNEVKTNSASSLGRIGSKRALPELYQCRNSIEPLHDRWVIEEAIDSILSRAGVSA